MAAVEFGLWKSVTPGENRFIGSLELASGAADPEAEEKQGTADDERWMNE